MHSNKDFDETFGQSLLLTTIVVHDTVSGEILEG